MDRRQTLVIGTVIIVILGGFFVFGRFNYSLEPEALTASIQENITLPPQKLNPPPSPIRGIYITSWVAGSKKRLNELIDLVNSTELNAVVIDVKDYSGYLSFKTSIPLAEQSGAHGQLRIADIDELINLLHQNNIYVIGRVQVFQDPILANARPELAVGDSINLNPWRDNKGLAWLDPAGRLAWDYTLDIIREMDAHGFDEVNLDYIRFPSDGNLERMVFPFWDGVSPRYSIIRSFYEYIRSKTAKDNIIISADIFGMAAWRASDFDYDLNIGQRMVDAIKYFDYVSPMVYPSHYSSGSTGFTVPAEHPYEIVFTSLKNTQDLIATTTSTAGLRPWLQDFDLGKDYTAEDVRAQIQATYDAGIDEWLLWNASNYYTKEALKRD